MLFVETFNSLPFQFRRLFEGKEPFTSSANFVKKSATLYKRMIEFLTEVEDFFLDFKDREKEGKFSKKELGGLKTQAKSLAERLQQLKVSGKQGTLFNVNSDFEDLKDSFDKLQDIFKSAEKKLQIINQSIQSIEIKAGTKK